MADWEVALEKQLATWLFYTSPKGKAYTDAYRRSVAEKYPWELPAWERMERDVIQMLWRSDPVYVTPDMMDLTEYALPTFETEPLREDELLIKNGFVYLPRPVHIKDVRGKRLGLRAIGWAQAMFAGTELEDGTIQHHEDPKRGVLVTFFSQFGDEDDYFPHPQDPEVLSAGRAYWEDALMIAHQLPLVYGEDIRADLSATRVVHMTDPEGDAVLDQEAIVMSAHDAFRLCQVLWRMMAQRVAVGFRSRAPRGQRKRLAKAGMAEKYVTVVTLRRPKQQPSEEHHHVEWQRRWIVSGHWRWQPYGDGTHRQIWIAPYVKGPDDKPLVIRGARVFRLAR